MNAVADNRTMWGSAAAHGAILVAVLSAYMLRGCIAHRTPREIVTFIAMQEAAPTIADLQMPPIPEPAKPEPEPAKPEPVPDPPKDIPEPEKVPPKPVKPKVEISKVKIKRPVPPKPVKPLQPLTAEELRRLLVSGKPVGPVGPPGPVGDFSFDWYLALIRKAMYDAWEQPGGLSASAGLKVVVEIRIARDGAILKRDILRTSGHPLMDESVRKALQDVRQAPPLPDAYRGSTRDIQIAFELTDGVI